MFSILPLPGNYHLVESKKENLTNLYKDNNSYHTKFIQIIKHINYLTFLSSTFIKTYYLNQNINHIKLSSEFIFEENQSLNFYSNYKSFSFLFALRYKTFL